MFSFRRWLLCATLACSLQLRAAPPLTTVQDIIYNADGTPFNGTITIAWPSFEASDSSDIAADSKRLQITNGILFVQLVPTTNAITPATYGVQYSGGGATQFSEVWAVPPSSVAVRVAAVRTDAPPSNSAASSTPILIADVTGLQSALNLRPVMGTGFTVSRAAVIDPTGALDGAGGNLSDCLHVDGSSGACGTGAVGATFVDSEMPSGTLDGSNASFGLANAPNPASSLLLFRNGLRLRQGGDYTLSGNSVSFLTGAVPQPGDILLASYRLSASVPGVSFVDQETPAGTVNGVNASFTLTQLPSPAASLALYRNGVRLTPGVDYTASGTAITFGAGFVPQTGDILVCSYRTAP